MHHVEDLTLPRLPASDGGPPVRILMVITASLLSIWFSIAGLASAMEEPGGGIPPGRLVRSPLRVDRESLWELHVRGGVLDRRLDLWGLDSNGLPIYIGRFPGPKAPKGAIPLGRFRSGQRIYLWHDLEQPRRGVRRAHDCADETAYRTATSPDGGYEISILDPAASGRVLLAMALVPRAASTPRAGPTNGQANGQAGGQAGGAPVAAAAPIVAMAGAQLGAMPVSSLAATPRRAGPATGVRVRPPMVGAPRHGGGLGPGAWLLSGLVTLCFVGAWLLNRTLRRRPEEMTPAELLVDAQRLLGRGSVEEGLLLLETLIETGPPGMTREVARLRRALHNIGAGHHAQARTDLLAIDVAVLAVEDLYTLGVALEEVEESLVAVGVYERVATRRPGHADVDERLNRIRDALPPSPQPVEGETGRRWTSPEADWGELGEVRGEPVPPLIPAADPPHQDAHVEWAPPSAAEESLVESGDGTGTGRRETVPETAPDPEPSEVPAMTRLTAAPPDVGEPSAGLAEAPAGPAPADRRHVADEGTGGLSAPPPREPVPATERGPAPVAHARGVLRSWGPPARRGRIQAESRPVPPGPRPPSLDGGVEDVLRRLPPHLTAVRVLTASPLALCFEARDGRMDRQVQGKVLAGPLAAHPDLCRQFLQQAQVLRDIAHPAVLRIYEVHPEVPAFTHEPLEGQMLAEEIARGGRLSIPRAITIGLRLTEGLRALHARSLVYRDLQPSRVFLEGDHVRLLDPGLAAAPLSRLIAPWEGAADACQGRSPEELAGGGGDARADVFGLGMTLYEALTGVSAPGPDPGLASDRRPGIPPALDLLVARCMRADPRDRFADCGQICDALLSIREEWLPPHGPRTALLSSLDGILGRRLRPLARLVTGAGGVEHGAAGRAPLVWEPSVRRELVPMLGGHDGLRAWVARILELATVAGEWARAGDLGEAIDLFERIARGVDALSQVVGEPSRPRGFIDRALAEPVGDLVRVAGPVVEAVQRALAAHEVHPLRIVTRIEGRYASLVRTVVRVEDGLRCRFPDPEGAAATLEQALERLVEAAIERGARGLSIEGTFRQGRTTARLDLADDGSPMAPVTSTARSRSVPALVEAARALVGGLGGALRTGPRGEGPGVLITIQLPTCLI